MCSGLVRFVLRHDEEKIFKFATLQSKMARETIPRFTEGQALMTVVLADEDGIHTESDAIIRLLVALGGFFKLAMVLRVFPKCFRDAIYRLIARYRYRLFGKTESCALLSEDERLRIIE